MTLILYKKINMDNLNKKRKNINIESLKLNKSHFSEIKEISNFWVIYKNNDSNFYWFLLTNNKKDIFEWENIRKYFIYDIWEMKNWKFISNNVIQITDKNWKENLYINWKKYLDNNVEFIFYHKDWAISYKDNENKYHLIINENDVMDNSKKINGFRYYWNWVYEYSTVENFIVNKEIRVWNMAWDTHHYNQNEFYYHLIIDWKDVLKWKKAIDCEYYKDWVYSFEVRNENEEDDTKKYKLIIDWKDVLKWTKIYHFKYMWNKLSFWLYKKYNDWERFILNNDKKINFKEWYIKQISCYDPFDKMDIYFDNHWWITKTKEELIKIN